MDLELVGQVSSQYLLDVLKNMTQLVHELGGVLRQRRRPLRISFCFYCAGLRGASKALNLELFLCFSIFKDKYIGVAQFVTLYIEVIFHIIEHRVEYIRTLSFEKRCTTN